METPEKRSRTLGRILSDDETRLIQEFPTVWAEMGPLVPGNYAKYLENIAQEAGSHAINIPAWADSLREVPSLAYLKYRNFGGVMLATFAALDPEGASPMIKNRMVKDHVVNRIIVSKYTEPKVNANEKTQPNPLSGMLPIFKDATCAYLDAWFSEPMMSLYRRVVAPDPETRDRAVYTAIAGRAAAFHRMRKETKDNQLRKMDKVYLAAIENNDLFNWHWGQRALFYDVAASLAEKDVLALDARPSKHIEMKPADYDIIAKKARPKQYLSIAA